MTLLLVALASTAAALLVQAASAVYDYRLQATHVANMALHVPTCHAACVADRQESAQLLQLRALGLNGAVMLVSNLVLLGLVVAFRGGRLDVATMRGVPVRAVRFDSIERVLIAALLGAAAVHAAAVDDQLGRWPVAGIVVLLLVMAEVDAVLLFLLRLRYMQYLATAAVSAVPLLMWLWSRTAGLPSGPDVGVREQIGLADGAAAVLEAVALVLALAALRRRGDRVPAAAQHRAVLALAGVVAVSTVGTAVGLGLNGAAATPAQQHHGHHAIGPLE